ncbi:MAG TPA: RNA polymerase sigma-70 factor [Chitinophagaceae bacterium]|nr:RNA polymerase sigma-70 factor [Chitinophagaceae bacterium]
MALYSSHTDNDLFLLISQGDEAAFAELFRRYDKRIYPFVLKMVKFETYAEEITQEIFIKLWVNRIKLADIDRPESYILTVAANHTLDQIKKNLREHKMLQRLAVKLKDADSNTTEETLLFRDSVALVEQAVDRLTIQQKKVYRLSRQTGLSNDEIAAHLNVSPNTVRNHLVEALRSIRSFLEEKGQTHLSSLTLMFLLMEKLCS